MLQRDLKHVGLPVSLYTDTQPEDLELLTVDDIMNQARTTLYRPRRRRNRMYRHLVFVF